jgi:hypothetical protein
VSLPPALCCVQIERMLVQTRTGLYDVYDVGDKSDTAATETVSIPHAMTVAPSPLDAPFQVLSASAEAADQTVAALRQIKNAVIGNRNRKLEVVRGWGRVER